MAKQTPIHIAKYPEELLTRALLLVVDQGVSLKDAALQTGISKRTIQRYRSKFVKVPEKIATPTGGTLTMFVPKETTLQNPNLQKVEKVLIDRTNFLDEVFRVKGVVLKQMETVAKKSNNLDALQKTVKMLDEMDNEHKPKGNVPPLTPGQVNIFQFLNEKLTKEGYEGPELTDADIVEGD
jgi:hypothetical protein